MNATALAWPPAAIHEDRCPLTGVRFHLRTIDPDEDLRLVHAWMNEAHVSAFWNLAKPIEAIREYLVGQSVSAHSRAYRIDMGETPMGYAEIYRVADDLLGRYFDARATDVGWHVFVGPKDLIGAGYSRAMGRVLLRFMFDIRGCERVVCEPDHRNLRMIRFTERLGHERRGTIDLPTKRAALMICERIRFEEAIAA